MEKLTYKQAYDKIIDAYFKDEIRPYDSEFCFCGTLAGGSGYWDRYENGNSILYTGEQFGKMEYALLYSIRKNTIGFLEGNKSELFASDLVESIMSRHIIAKHENYEEALFEGMCAALDVLKQIHIERGEVIDEPTTQFTKRTLATN